MQCKTRKQSERKAERNYTWLVTLNYGSINYVNNINILHETEKHHLQENQVKYIYWKWELLINKKEITKYTQWKTSGCWGALPSNKGLSPTLLNHQPLTKNENDHQ